MADVDDLATTVRAIVDGVVAAWPATRVVVPASAGVDSNAVVLALRDAGKKVTVASFTLQGRESTDFLAAEENARRLGLPFLPVYLPTDPRVVDADLRRLIVRDGLRHKTTIECVWPFLYVTFAANRAGFDGIATGAAADGHYGLSKNALIHHRGTVEALDGFRRRYFASDHGPAWQAAFVDRLARTMSMTAIAPWADSRMIEAFMGWSWGEVNRPRQKEPARRAFPALDALVINPHTNLQLGDSGIAALLGSVALGLAPGRWKNPVGAYNAIAAGRL